LTEDRVFTLSGQLIGKGHLVRLALGEIQQGCLHRLRLRLGLRIGAGNQIEGMAGAGIHTQAAPVKTLGEVDLAVLCIGSTGGADEQTDTILGTECYISCSMHQTASF
jgi:hypothetical protein